MSKLGVILCALAIVVGGGCQTTTPAREVADRADRDMAHGSFSAAAAAYRDAAALTSESNDHLRLVLLSLLAERAAASTPAEKDRVRDALRAFARQAEASQWGRVAAVVAAEIGAADVLREALVRVSADLAAAERERAVLTEQLAALKADLSTRDQELALSVAERDAALQRVRDLEDALRATSAREAALLAELDALKRIDMQRTP